jgi:hypothetical protein
MLGLRRDTSGHETAAESTSVPNAFPQDQRVDPNLVSLRILRLAWKWSGRWESNPVLHVSSNIVLQFLENGNVIPFVILKGKLIDTHGAAPTWNMRHAASIGGPRPLDGERGWMSEGGASLKMSVSSALERALLVMLTDVSSPFPRDDKHKSAADGYFPFMSKRLHVVGYSITEDADWIAFSPKIIGTSLLAGVNIMDKSVTKIRVATKDDRRIGVSSERP